MLQENDALEEGLSQRNRRLLLGLVLSVYLIVTVLYGVINPLFEAPDEHWHFFTVQFIAENGRLPAVPPGDDFDVWMRQEAAQPPLYYLAGALLTAPIDASTAREDVWLNKFASIGDAGDLININRFVHAQTEAWPWQGYALAAHILRLFSTALGFGTLICIYLSGRLLWPRRERRALLATAMVAFLPQFNFVHAAISNDPLIIFLVSAALWQLVRMWQTETNWKRLLLLGLTVGLAALAKNAGITLLIYAVGVLVLLAIRGANRSGELTSARGDWGGWRLVAGTVLLVIVPAILVAGWLWARNLSLYGDFTATNQFIRFAGGDRNYTLFKVLRESRGLWLSSFAVFGWFNVRAPDWVYWFWNGTVVIAAAGAAWRAITDYQRRRQYPKKRAVGVGFWERLQGILVQGWFLPLLLAMWVLAVYASLVVFMLQTEAAQGRLLFPALLPLALGLASGLTATMTLRRIAPIFPTVAAVITAYCLFFVLRPAYAKPPVVMNLPSDVEMIDMEMGSGIRLLGAHIETDEVQPGDPVWLTLYWRRDAVGDEAPELVLSLFGRDQEEIGKVHSYHGQGLYPAGLWPQGRIIADRLGFFVDERALTPVLGRIDVTIKDGNTVQAGELKIAPEQWPPLEMERAARFGPLIDLLAVDVAPQAARPGELIEVKVRWQARGEPEKDYTTLLHLGQPDEPPLATGDRPPLNGRYPTHVWANGEQFDDAYELALPSDLTPGRYPVWIGMYDTKTLERLPVTIEDIAQPFNVYLAGWIDVE